jgi:hypothetical protein
MFGTRKTSVRELRAATSSGLPPDAVTDARNCARLLEAWHLVGARDPAGRAALEEFDNWMRAGPPGGLQIYCANLLIAKWWEARGELRRALNAARRRHIGTHTAGPRCLSSFRR